MILDTQQNHTDNARATVPFLGCGNATPFQGNSETAKLITKCGWGGSRANSGGRRPGAGRPRKPVRSDPVADDDAEHWYCVRTTIGNDLTADIEIRLAGFIVFSPTIWKPAVAARRDAKGIVHPGLPERIVPMFRSYLFTRFRRTTFEWAKILHLPGVQRILSSQGRPIAVPDAVIEALQAVLHPNGCNYDLQQQASPQPFAKGSHVRAVEGPMADLTGICEMSDGKRVRMLLEIMGRAVSVTMAQSAVEVVP